LFWIILIVLGAITALGILLAGVIMPLFTGTSFTAADNALAAGLTQVLFPVVLLLGLTGLMVGILQSYDQFTIPAIAPAFGSLVSSAAPRAIDQAFRIYMLPQGVFSVAVATVLFPTLSRQAARRAVAEMRRTVANGVRQINLLLIPSAALILVLAVPITRL